VNTVAKQVGSKVRTAEQGGLLLRTLLHPVAIGLLLGLAVAIGLTAWFFSQARAELDAERETRNVVIDAMALADLVTAQQSTVDASDEALARIVADWTREADRYARVVRLSGARMLASSFPPDAGESLPRRLSRDEKWLYDLGQELRAAVETNRSEGVFRKNQIEITRIGEDRLLVTLPYGPEGDVDGFVQLETDIERPGRAVTLAPALLAVLAPFALFCVLLTFSGRGQAGRRPWLRWALALAVLVAVGWIYAANQLGRLEAAWVDDNEGVAQLYGDVRTRAATLAGREGLNSFIAPTDGNRWDVDVFQRPLGIVTAAGAVDEAAAAAALAQKSEQLVKASAGNVMVGALLLSFFALGFARRVRETLLEFRYAYLYVAPAMLGMLVLVFFPFAYGIALSFTGQTIFNVSEPLTELWVGLANYASILGDFDVIRTTAEGWVINYQNFYWTLFITVCWTVSNVTVGVTFGMVLALALNTEGLRGKAIYRVLLILPWAIPNYITALIWKGLFHPQFGAINQAIQMFGGEPVAWFDGVFSAFMTGLATNGWLSFPFMMVVILGGLQSISHDMYEAATVEGATRAQQFWRITLPLLKPTLVPAVILSVVWTFNMFNVIYLVSGGAPAGANEILITKAYKIAFEEYRYAYSAAYSTVIFLILLVYGVFQTRMTRATEAAHA